MVEAIKKRMRSMAKKGKYVPIATELEGVCNIATGLSQIINDDGMRITKNFRNNRSKKSITDGIRQLVPALVVAAGVTIAIMAFRGRRKRELF